MRAQGLSLSCANCGLRLPVGGDHQRIACRYCGALQGVRRGSETFVLRTLAIAPDVPSRTSRAASEVALRKLRLELEAVEEHYHRERARLQPSAVLAALAVVIAGLGFVAWLGPLIGGLATAAVAAFVTAGAWHARRECTRLQCDYVAACASLQRQIFEHRRIVDGQPPQRHGP